MNSHSIHIPFEQCDCLVEGKTRFQIKQLDLWNFNRMSCPVSLMELGSSGAWGKLNFAEEILFRFSSSVSVQVT